MPSRSFLAAADLASTGGAAQQCRRGGGALVVFTARRCRLAGEISPRPRWDAQFRPDAFSGLHLGVVGLWRRFASRQRAVTRGMANCHASATAGDERGKARPARRQLLREASRTRNRWRRERGESSSSRVSCARVLLLCDGRCSCWGGLLRLLCLFLCLCFSLLCLCLLVLVPASVALVCELWHLWRLHQSASVARPERRTDARDPTPPHWMRAARGSLR